MNQFRKWSLIAGLHVSRSNISAKRVSLYVLFVPVSVWWCAVRIFQRCQTLWLNKGRLTPPLRRDCTKLLCRRASPLLDRVVGAMTNTNKNLKANRIHSFSVLIIAGDPLNISIHMEEDGTVFFPLNLQPNCGCGSLQS